MVEVALTHPIRIMLVDDHAVLLRALEYMLAREPDLTVVAQDGSLAEARKHLADGIDVDIVLVDLDLPDGSGVELIRDVRSANPRAYVAVLSGTLDARKRALAIEAGASGVLSKSDTDPKEVVSAIRLMYAGKSLISPAEAVELVAEGGRVRAEEQTARAALTRLTPRERDILQTLADGLGDKAIAARLGISDRTVSNHVVGLLDKLGVESRLQALILAVRLGVVKIR